MHHARIVSTGSYAPDQAESQQRYRQIMQRLIEARGIILGCTEIGLLVSPADAPVPLFDTAALHVRFAAEWALDDPS